MGWYDDKPEIITEVSRHKNTWHIATKGSGFGFDVKYTKGRGAPKVGDEVIVHCYQGMRIRGVTLRGEQLFYKSEEELSREREEYSRKRDLDQQKQFKKERKKLNEAYDALPIEFQRRISWFRANNPDFRWEFEAYEMSVCTDAVKIAEKYKTLKGVNRFAKMRYETQMKHMPDLYQGHSGNSFSCAILLAKWYVQNPLWVIAQHGALTPLVGCEEYGCAHPRPADVLASIPEETNE